MSRSTRRHESPEERTDYTHADRAGADKLLAWTRANRASLVCDANISEAFRALVRRAHEAKPHVDAMPLVRQTAPPKEPERPAKALIDLVLERVTIRRKVGKKMTETRT